MVKAIKIKIDGSVEEVVDGREDPEYQDMRMRRSIDTWCLSIPEHWEHKKFKLSMSCYGFFEPDDPLNKLATILWLKIRNSGLQPIVGTVYLFNEDDDDMIDFTMEDFKYIMDKLN